MTVTVSLFVIVAGAVLLRWNDAFHLAVALPIMAGGAVLAVRLARAAQGEDDPAEADDEPLIVRTLRGAIVGALLVALGAGGLAVATRSPVYGWFYDRDLERAVEHVQVLEQAGDFDAAVRLIDERGTRDLSAGARTRLETMRVRALVQSAERLRGADRIARLREAFARAVELDHPDLRELIAAKLRADENEDRLAQLQLAVRESARGLVVTLPDVLFASGSDRLVESARAQIQQIVSLLNEPDHAARRVSVEGHADATGGDPANQQLSTSRASAVAAALAEAGVDAARLDAKGFASSQPVGSNQTAEGRAKNRRVEVVLLSEGTGRRLRGPSS